MENAGRGASAVVDGELEAGGHGLDRGGGQRLKAGRYAHGGIYRPRAGSPWLASAVPKRHQDKGRIPRRSKLHAEHQLDLARIARSRDPAEGSGRGDIGCGSVQNGVVQQIEGLPAEAGAPTT